MFPFGYTLLPKSGAEKVDQCAGSMPVKSEKIGGGVYIYAS